jgi:hypothetical protein
VAQANDIIKTRIETHPFFCTDVFQAPELRGNGVSLGDDGAAAWGGEVGGEAWGAGVAGVPMGAGVVSVPVGAAIGAGVSGSSSSPVKKSVVPV